MAGMAESEYSFSLTTFAPSGKLAQIESALAAVEKGNDALGIKCKDGVWFTLWLGHCVFFG